MMLGVTWCQVFYVGIHTSDCLDYYTHVIGVITEECPRLDILQSQGRKKLREF